jgi:O-antigen biosynthesis protein
VSALEYPIIWPPLSDEIKPFRKYCQGLVLNAGSGKRALGLGKRELNIDIVPDTEPDIVGDLHSIPLRDQSVDTIVSVAVLEHTKFPWMVAQEFYRILKPGGYGVIAVPFIQPQHACPDDYCRFTENGLIELSKYTGFNVLEVAHVHHFGQTVAWLLWEYLQENLPQNKLVLRFWLWLIRQLSLGNFLASDSSNTHNTHYVVVQKPGTLAQTAEAKALLQDQTQTWFLPLLACPNTRQSLHRQDKHLVSEDGRFTYQISETRPILLPSTDPRTWKTVVTRGGETEPVLTPATSKLVTSKLVESKPIASKPIESEASAGSVTPTSAPTSDSTAPSDSAADHTATVIAPNPELHVRSEQAFLVSFKSPFAERLRQANPSKIAVLATNEYEGIFKNGGIGTHYKTLSEQLTKNGWHVVLLLCTYDQTYDGTSEIAAVKNIFSIRDLNQVLNLQPIHQATLASFGSEWKDWVDHQSFSCLLFTQAISTLFPNLPIYVEFHEMTGIGYHTIQAKQGCLLSPNCLIGVTMHSGHEWIYEANEWFAKEYPIYYQQACDYEQFSFENADLTFFPSHYLKAKVESYGWRADKAKHMPYFIPILPDVQPGSALNDAVVSAALNHPRGKVPVVFFGRMEMRKGIITFVEAIQKLSPEIQEQIHVHFVGKVVQLHVSKFGDLKSNQYVQQALADKITYTLHPDFYSDQAIQFIRTLRNPIVCLASHQENFPNTGLEMGQLPISLVVSDTGGFRETLKFVNREAGIYWFKPANATALADMLSKAFFNQPEVPAVSDLAELEAINIQLWDQKLNLIEAVLQTAQAAVQTHRPKVVVGVTCDQSSPDLIDCLISLEAQTYDNLEVIVLGNASLDLETQQLFAQAGTIFSTYKFMQAADLGHGAQRDLIEQAEGDYFLSLDATHRLTTFAVETLVKTAIHAQAEVVVSSRVVVGANSYLDTTFRQTSIPAMLQASANHVCCLASTKLLQFWLQQHGQVRDGVQNGWILPAAIATGAKIIHYPYPLYEFYLHSDSTMPAASFEKERYDLRQYLTQIPVAEWSPRQIQMMAMAIQELNAQQQQWQTQTQQAQAETQQARAELAEFKQKLKTARGNLRRVRENLEQIQLELRDTKGEISAMKTSKFWKIRQAWFKAKKVLNLPSE